LSSIQLIIIHNSTCAVHKPGHTVAIVTVHQKTWAPLYYRTTRPQSF